MNDYPNLDPYTKCDQVQDAANGFMERSGSLYDGVMPMGHTSIQWYANESICWRGFAQTMAPCRIAEESAIRENLERRLRRNTPDVLHEPKEVFPEKCRFTTSDEQAGRRRPDQVDHPVGVRHKVWI